MCWNESLKVNNFELDETPAVIALPAPDNCGCGSTHLHLCQAHLDTLLDELKTLDPLHHEVKCAGCKEWKNALDLVDLNCSACRTGGKPDRLPSTDGY